MSIFRGKILAAVPVHLSRWLEEDEWGRNPALRAGGLEGLIESTVGPILARTDAAGKPLVDGILFNRLSGILKTGRPIGKRSDGEVVLSWCVSIAETTRYREWLEPMRALAARTLLVAHDGIPVGPAPLISCAALRYKRMGIRAVSLDASGQNLSLAVRANMVELERRGVVAMAEPAPLAKFRPPWLGDRPCCTNGERWEVVTREVGRGVAEKVPEGIDWYNGADDGPWQWDAVSALASAAAGRTVAVPANMLSTDLVAPLRAALAAATTTEGAGFTSVVFDGCTLSNDASAKEGA